MDESSNSSNESTSHKKEESTHHTDNEESLIKDSMTPINSEGNTMNSLMFETPDLMEDVLGCLDDKYRKFLMG